MVLTVPNPSRRLRPARAGVSARNLAPVRLFFADGRGGSKRKALKVLKSVTDVALKNVSLITASDSCKHDWKAPRHFVHVICLREIESQLIPLLMRTLV